MIFDRGDKLIFIGDSITDYDRKRPVGEGLFDGWGKSYVAQIGALLGCMYPEEQLRVISMGNSGDQVSNLRARWQRDVLDLAPDWVSVLIGINDVWRQFDSPQITEDHMPLEVYEKTYESLIVSTRPQVKGMILMTPFFMEPNLQDPMRARMDAYGAVVKRLAQKHSLILVDLQSAWDRLFAHMHPCAIAWDRIHPNQTGCMYIAKQFLAAVGFER